MDAAAESGQEAPSRNVAKIKREIIDHYDNIIQQIDIRTETLLENLPDALKTGREELMERIREEKEKSLAALADDSPLMRYRNEYYQRFLQLRQEYEGCQGDSDEDKKKREEVVKNLDQLKKDLKLLEEFLDDFKNRTLVFEEPDPAVYGALIGELVTSEEINRNQSGF